jgi:CheY-like chemotaxis protein
LAFAEALLRVLKLVLLEGAHLQAVTVTAPELALSLIEATRPEMVLLDTSLSGQQSWGFLQAFRQHGRFNTLPVLIFSESLGDNQEDAVRDDHWTERIFKPFDLDTILQHMHRLMQWQSRD